MSLFEGPAMSRRTFLSTTAGATMIAIHPFSARAAAGQAHLRIMETTDLHVHILGGINIFRHLTLYLIAGSFHKEGIAAAASDKGDKQCLAIQ